MASRALLVLPLLVVLAAAETVVLQAVRDNTLIERSSNAPPSVGYNSNGAGPAVFIGRVSDGTLRRAVLAFDVARKIPAGSVVNMAALSMNVNLGKNMGQIRPSSLHRLRTSFGEGASSWFGGIGAEATPGDATWIDSVTPDEQWTTPGGDFDAEALATTDITTTGGYSWSSAALAGMVAAWANAPQDDHGILVMGDESCTDLLTCAPTALRLDSREGAEGDLTLAPTLTVDYTPPDTALYGTCCLPSGACALQDSAACLTAGGVPSGNGVESDCDAVTCSAQCSVEEILTGTCVIGGCCLPAGTCTVVTKPRCSELDGDYQGPGSTCDVGQCSMKLELYVDELPRPSLAQPYEGRAGAAGKYTFVMQETQHKMHRDLPPTTVWTYNGLFPGPTIEAWQGEPIEVTWVNDLRDTANGGALRTEHYLDVLECIHGPNFNGPVPLTVPHVHGGVIPMRHDGHPDFQFPPGINDTYHYPNEQRAAMLWYHDHGLGITRLNVYMGLAGAYFVRDEHETNLRLPSGKYEMPLVIMDRSFNPDGSLKFQPTWASTFFGDYYVVNGKISPFMRVERTGYRFRILNGCNARVLTLQLSRSRFFVIGSDGGLLKRRDKVKKVQLSPGERLDIVIDFSNVEAGYRIDLLNRQPAQHANQNLLSKKKSDTIMQFHVVDSNAKKRKPPKYLDADFKKLKAKNKYTQRVFRLYEEADTCGGKKLTINGLGWDDITEFPSRGSREVWLFANLDPGHVHPMHIHLAHFQLISRQPLVRIGENDFALVDEPVTPERWESGWKNTVHVGPHEAAQVVVQFPYGYVGRFPFHCHSLEHEDHDMMRQLWITQKKCNEDGVCGDNEDCFSCPEDCGDLVSGARCGNGMCEAGDGENCLSCPQDCAGTIGSTCCGTGNLVLEGVIVGSTEVGCGDALCKSEGYRCRHMATVQACCGDSVCTGAETAGSCPLDCLVAA